MRKLTFLTLLLCFSRLTAQFSVESFLAASVEDAELMEVRNSLDYLSTHRFNSPWIREVDLRIRSNDLQPDLEDYRMRFGLINPLEIRANARYHSDLSNTLEAEKLVKHSEVIKQRYILLIENTDLAALLTLTREKLAALRRVEAVFNGDPLDDWIELQADITKTELYEKELTGKVRINEFLIRERMAFEGPIRIDTASLVTENQLFDLIRSLLAEDETGLLATLNAQRTILRQSALALERAENRSNIGYIQAEYDGERGNALDEHMGFQFGVAIPIVNAKKPDYQREVLKQLEAETKDSMDEMEKKREMKVATMDLEYRRDNLIYLQERLLKLSAISSELSSPELYLRYLEYKHYLMESQLGEKSDLMRTLVELLHEKGKLAETPAVNYLSRNFTTY